MIGSNLYAHDDASDDLRRFADGTTQVFSFIRSVSASASGGTLIGAFTEANIATWGANEVPDDSLTTPKYRNNSVTLAKLSEQVRTVINRVSTNTPKWGSCTITFAPGSTDGVISNIKGFDLSTLFTAGGFDNVNSVVYFNLTFANSTLYNNFPAAGLHISVASQSGALSLAEPSINKSGLGEYFSVIYVRDGVNDFVTHLTVNVEVCVPEEYLVLA